MVNASCMLFGDVSGHFAVSALIIIYIYIHTVDSFHHIPGKKTRQTLTNHTQPTFTSPKRLRVGPAELSNGSIVIHQGNGLTVENIQAFLHRFVVVVHPARLADGPALDALLHGVVTGLQVEKEGHLEVQLGVVIPSPVVNYS